VRLVDLLDVTKHAFFFGKKMLFSKKSIKKHVFGANFGKKMLFFVPPYKLQREKKVLKCFFVFFFDEKCEKVLKHVSFGPTLKRRKKASFQNRKTIGMDQYFYFNML
jgi:hypothetical protein